VLAIPESLEGLVRDRIDSLPQASRPVMLFASALSAPTASVIAAVAGERATSDALAAAAAAGVVDVTGDAVRFNHPLLSAAIYGEAAGNDLRAAHRALANVVTDPEERARHLALSTPDPDEAVAQALEDAARTARSRGAGAAAAELAEAAVRLTPADLVDERRRRTMVAADHHRDAGDVPRAVGMLDRLAAETTGPARAPVLAALGEKLLHTGDRAAAGRAFEEALPLAGDDLALRVRVETGLAAVAHLTWVDWRDGDRHMTNALRHAEALGEPVLIKETMGHYATWSFQMGRGIERDLIARANALPDSRGEVHVGNHPDFQLGSILISAGELDEARRIFERLLSIARQRGEWFNLPWVLMRLVRLEIAAGNWRLAEAYLEEGRRTSQQSGQDAAEGYLAHDEVHLLALRGEVDRCRAAAAYAFRVSDQMRLVHRVLTVASAVTLLDLSLRDPASAYRTIEPVLAFDGPGHSEPSLLRPMLPLAVEALVGLGRLDEAEALLVPYERLAEQHARAMCIADALHCRALLSAASGALEAAEEMAEASQRGFEALGMPFDAARAALVLADVHRRGRHKAAAREAASDALASFERLGAARWADRAREELARAEGRRAPGSELTETEQRVVDLVVGGRTNREIAGALFMSVHTVEAHLTRIYRAVGVRSRTELARRTLDRRGTDAPG
jgi:DNA-binding NarL/FixJ family response regulator